MIKKSENITPIPDTCNFWTHTRLMWETTYIHTGTEENETSFEEVSVAGRSPSFLNLQGGGLLPAPRLGPCRGQTFARRNDDTTIEPVMPKRPVRLRETSDEKACMSRNLGTTFFANFLQYGCHPLSREIFDVKRAQRPPADRRHGHGMIGNFSSIRNVVLVIHIQCVFVDVQKMRLILHTGTPVLRSTANDCSTHYLTISRFLLQII